MVEIKSYEFEKILFKKAPLYHLFLIYGPDRGLVLERIDQLKEIIGIPYDNPFSFISLNSSELQKDPTKLLDEVNSIGLFNEKKLILIKDVLNEKSIIECLEQIAKQPPEKNRIIITAGDLKKGNPLRKIGEMFNTIVSIPCYSDDKRTLNSLIDNELLIEKSYITPEARQTLLELLGGDRIASRNELRKLALYCLGKPLIKETDVLDIIGDSSIVSVDDAVDAIICGNTYNLIQLSQKILLEKISINLLLQACLRKFQLLDRMLIEIEDANLSITEVIQNFGQNLFFKRKPAIQKALKIWKVDNTKEVLYRINEAIQEIRKIPMLEKAIVMQTLLLISNKVSEIQNN